MPFLTRKTLSMDDKGGMSPALRAETSSTWGEDSYQLSGGSKQFEATTGGMPFAEASACASPECSGRWRAPWKSRRRPIFDGQWGCSRRCIVSIVSIAVRREIGDSATSWIAPHRHRIPLGLLMLAQGWITQEQLRRGLEAQKLEGSGRIGDWLKNECGLAPEQLTRGLGMQWGCPVLTTDQFLPDEMALILPKIFVEEFGLLPIRIAASRIIYLGSAAQLDASVALALEQMSGLSVQSGVVEEGLFAEAKRSLLKSRGVECRHESLPNNDAMVARIASVLEQKQPAASRFVRLHQYYWLRLWLEPAAMSEKAYLPATTGEDVVDYIFTVGTGD